ncbi:MAG TPA: L-threonylcarbamoyladenylate synthase [Iamia sp.]|nr:L-threonylcarbamoyladenylate synthase [Iamia sp.]
MTDPDPGLVDRLVEALLAGEPVVIPTDTVYGVAALPSVPGATARLYALKDRRPDVPLAVLVADVAALDGLAATVDDRTAALVAAHWPGPLTVVVRRHPDRAGWDLGGDPGTVGVRCPDDPLVRAVAARTGPIATTSANRSGEPTPPTAAEAAASLTGPVAVVADGGTLDGQASTVVDLTVDPWRILRQGALDIG